jgi:uncharacterized protein (DUF2062 family)
MRRVIQYVRNKTPTREDLQRMPLLRPIAHKLDDPNLWHLNRRSVTRGVGVGLFFAILIPVAHTILVIAATIPVRANAIVSLGVSWAVNPVTLPPLIFGAHTIGAWIVAPAVGAAIAVAPVGWWAITLDWIATTGIGLLPLAIIVSGAATLAVRIGWDMRTRLRWARRNRRRKAARA